MEYVRIDWVQLYQDREQWLAVVKIIIKCPVPKRELLGQQSDY
jgi:hypothetical protein